MDNKKGFITIATGKDKYYILAHNLLRSYRYHSQSPTPFAILCDRENEWTAGFDQIVLIDNPACAIADKLRILDLSPYDETIFIDADSLVYKDLEPLWCLFKDGPDVSVLGHTYPPDDSEHGWWEANNLGELRNQVDYKMTCQGGVYYVRKNGKDYSAFLKTCQNIQAHYMDYRFRIFPDQLEDETIFCLASCVHHFRPVKDWVDIFAYYPEIRLLEQDILSASLSYEWCIFPGSVYRDSFLIHFSTSYAANRWEYKKEIFKLKNGPLRISNSLEYLRLRMAHFMKKSIKTFRRRLKIKPAYELDIYY